MPLPWTYARTSARSRGDDDRENGGQLGTAAPLGQRLALDELHHQVGLVVLDARVVDGDEARVAQPGEEGALARETGTVHGVDDQFAQDLHRDVPVEHEVARPADDAHPAVPEVSAEQVPAPEDRR